MKECCNSYLNEQFGGEKELIDEIYSEYVSSINEKIKEAAGALVSGDWKLLDVVAHTIKGNALAVGDKDMADTAISMRTSAQLSDHERASALLARIKDLSTTL